MPTDPSYGEAPPNRSTFVFAQLCSDTEGIDVEKSTIINLYDNSDNIRHLPIAGNQFMAYFYPDGRSFSINCDASGTRVENVPMKQTFSWRSMKSQSKSRRIFCLGMRVGKLKS